MSLNTSDFLGSGFMTSNPLEDVLNGRCQDERESLLCHQSKHFTLVSRPQMIFGVYNKINYLSSCYNFCWLTNNEYGQRTKSLVCFGGGVSQIGSILAMVLILLFAALPFAAIWPFLINSLETRCFTGLLIFTACMEFFLFLWHFYCVYVIKKRNLEVWLNSWFTFSACSETLEHHVRNNASKTHSFFCLYGKLHIMDVSVSDLCRLNSTLPEITVTAREKLATFLENHRLEQAAIILYSEEFLMEFFMYSLYAVFLLSVLSAASCVALAWKIGTTLF